MNMLKTWWHGLGHHCNVDEMNEDFECMAYWGVFLTGGIVFIILDLGLL